MLYFIYSDGDQDQFPAQWMEIDYKTFENFGVIIAVVEMNSIFTIKVYYY